jgi:hypothetical protein
LQQKIESEEPKIVSEKHVYWKGYSALVWLIEGIGRDWSDCIAATVSG